MKKLITTMVVVGALVTSVMSVSAAEVDGEFVSNMTSETYVSRRTEQVEKALADGKITSEQADLLLAHIQEVAAEGSFGQGPNNGNKGEGNAECILGEDGNFGIFRSGSAGQRTGEGNGIGNRVQDGTGSGQGYKGAKRGNGQRQGAADGTGPRGNTEDCELVQ